MYSKELLARAEENKVSNERLERILSVLFKKYKKIEYLDRGRHAVVLIADRKYAVKIEKEIPAAKDSVKNEAEMLKLANKNKLGPKFTFYNQELRFVVYKFVKGIFMKDYSLDRKTVLDLLEKARILDKMYMNKEEMHRPYKNIIVKKKGKVQLIDFERMKRTAKPKNVSQLAGFFKMKGIFDDKMMKLVKEYKKEIDEKKKDKIFFEIENLLLKCR